MPNDRLNSQTGGETVTDQGELSQHLLSALRPMPMLNCRSGVVLRSLRHVQIHVRFEEHDLCVCVCVCVVVFM